VPDEAPLEDELDDDEEELEELDALEVDEPEEVELPEEEPLAKLLPSPPPPQADSNRHNGARKIHRRMRPLRRLCRRCESLTRAGYR
jgi:hypothetical protein